MNISDLESNISSAQKKITNYKSIISSIDKINEQLNLCAETLITTGDLIGEAIVVDGKPSDNGKTAEIANEVTDCADSFTGICTTANQEIDKLNKKISGWRSQISSLQRQEQQ